MDRRLGEPLPHQLANPTRAHQSAINLSPKGRIRYYSQFPGAIPYRKVGSHALLTRLPLTRRCVRLACVKPAASVRSEPGSNSQVETFNPAKITFRDQADARPTLDEDTPSVSRQSGIVSVLKRVRRCLVDPFRDPQGQRHPRFSFHLFTCQRTRRNLRRGPYPLPPAGN